MHKTTYRHTEKEEGTSAGEMAGAKVVKDGSPLDWPWRVDRSSPG